MGQNASELWVCPLCERKFKVPIGTQLDACPDCQKKPVLSRSSRPAPDNPDDWYIMHYGQEVTRGPFPIEALREMFQTGELAETDFAKQGRRGKLVGVFSLTEITNPLRFTDLPVVTTESLGQSDMRVEQSFSVISARRIYGINIVGDIFAGVRDLVGGRSARLETAASDIERELLQEIREQAGELGATAVVGYRLQIGNLSGGSSFMMYGFAQGTPVIVGRVEPPGRGTFRFDDE